MTPALPREVYERLPKVELHRHLEGSVRLSTLAEAMRRIGIDPGGGYPDCLRPLFQVVPDEPRDFLEFLTKIRRFRCCYLSYEMVRRIAYEVAEDAAKEGIRYLELRFNPHAQTLARGLDLRRVTEEVIRGAHEGAERRRMRVAFLITLNRDAPREECASGLEVARRYRPWGVVGVDLAGDETRYPASLFQGLFHSCRNGTGLGVTVHAGEAAGPESVLDAVLKLGAHRVGHGIAASRDPRAMALLADRGIPLEVCVTSNLHTGVVRGMKEHPLPDLIAAGVPVTLGADDPTVSGITLTDEYQQAVEKQGLTLAQLKEAVLTGARSSFLPESERRALAEELSREFDRALGAVAAL